MMETAIVDALATFRITRLIVDDTWPPILRLRDWVHERWPPNGKTLHADDGWTFEDRGSEKPTMGHRWVHLVGLEMRVSLPVDPGAVIGDEPPNHAVALKAHPIGELFSCGWCMGWWVACGVVTTRRLAPGLWGPVAQAFAFSAVAGVIASKT